jgi:ribose transport system substrate-binding protein
VNAIVLDSNSLTALNPAIATAHKDGIPVVAVNDEVSSTLAYHVETVGKQFGATMAEGFVNLIHKKGNIVVLRGIAGNAVDAAEASGFNSVLSQFPKIHVKDVLYPQWDDAQAQTDMETLLNNPSTPHIDGVFTEGGMEQGVVRAYQLTHHPFVPVSGTDENGFACQLKQFKSQGLTGVQVGTAIWAYALALKSALSILSGKSVSHHIPIFWTKWNTAQSIAKCSPKLPASLFLQVASPKQGIDLTPAEVVKQLG